MKTNEEDAIDIWDIIKSNKTAMLTTGTSNGFRGRPMQIIQDSYEGTICFLAPSESDPVSEILNNPEVGVTFINDLTGNYLSLSGTGSISDDEQLKKTLWSEDVAWLFPSGTDHQGVSVIEISISQGESWRDTEGSTKLYERIYAFVENRMPIIEMQPKTA
ncbi:MAG: pyridoxamine 5'-phosphate oxidase family protein [Flavobacteriales bacterium]|nr:pyridoxamine 5'-phosphate oxidase family protein [Flavobacteriales bacterium]